MSTSAASRTYLDHAATTPVRPEVAEQVAADLREGLGGWANPAAQHASGRRVGAMLARARARLAAALDVDPHEVLFTSGGTEADALVVTGRTLAARDAGVRAPRVVTSPLEHPAVLDSARTAAARLGGEHVEVGVDEAGLVDPESLREAVAGPGTALVSIMAANNETGVVQDMAGLVEVVRESSGARRPADSGYVPVHSDAVAALGKTPVDFRAWGLDAMTVTGHKLGAPIGIGALVAKRDLMLVTPTGGGRQERGVRSGSQDVIGARALALAVELAVAERAEETGRFEVLRRRVLEGATALPGVHATLPEGSRNVAHVPSTAHLWFEDGDTEALLMALDMAGIDVSAGSACHAGVTQPSHVLLSMGFDEGPARATLRCSMGRGTSADDVERLLAALPAALESARRAYSAGRAGR